MTTPSARPSVPFDGKITVPGPARVYDYLLGGVHNFAVDRQLGDALLREYPAAAQAARANREFIVRAVHWLLDLGVRQFLDLGSGMPTFAGVHDLVHGVDPATRVVYVDNDPLTVVTTERLIAGNPHAWAIHGDLRDPNEFLYHGQVVEHLDFDQPVAVLAGAVLHHIPDADHPAALVNRIAAYLVTGSYLVLSHVAPETTTEDNARLRAAVRLYEQTGTPVVPRSAEEIAALLGDAFDILPPGVSAADQWLRDYYDEPARCPPNLQAVIARRRRTEAEIEAEAVADDLRDMLGVAALSPRFRGRMERLLRQMFPEGESTGAPTPTADPW